jgi:hypothetical protein
MTIRRISEPTALSLIAQSSRTSSSSQTSPNPVFNSVALGGFSTIDTSDMTALRKLQKTYKKALVNHGVNKNHPTIKMFGYRMEAAIRRIERNRQSLINMRPTAVAIGDMLTNSPFATQGGGSALMTPETLPPQAVTRGST